MASVASGTGVVPTEEVCDQAGITVVNTSFQHNDMRDTGPEEAKSSIQGMLDKFLDDDSPLRPVDVKSPKIGALVRIVLHALHQRAHLTVLLGERLEHTDEAVQARLHRLHGAGALGNHRIHRARHGYHSWLGCT